MAPGSEEAAVSLSANDEFLDTIAQQARVAYASQQLQVLQDMIQRWQTQTVWELGAADRPRVQHELVYYTQQMQRWQEYLERLATASKRGGVGAGFDGA